MQVSPTSVYAGFRTAPAVGTTLVFYDLATLEDNGKANITSIEAVDDQNIINNFQNGLSELQLLDWDIVPVLIELDSEVNMTNSYALLDAIQVLYSRLTPVLKSSFPMPEDNILQIGHQVLMCHW